MNERVLPCAYIMKAARSSEVIRKSNDPRRLRQTAPAATREAF